MKRDIAFYIVLLLVTMSCNNNDETTAIDTFHSDYYNVNIAPSISNFKVETEKYIKYVNTFKAQPSASNFSILQEQWLKTTQAFSKTRVYNMVAVKAQFFDIIIYNFPVNPTLIENNIEEKANYDAAYLSSKSTVAKGLATLEYLLFYNQDSNKALLMLQENEFRVNYMLGVAQDVLRQANLLIEFWEQDYKDVFINATSISCTENARCLSFNQVINIMDVIRVTKVGKPAGLEDSSSATIESLEAFRSGNSLELIKSTVEEVEHVYTLSTVNFSEIVDDISGNSQISDEINKTFTEVYRDIDAINTNLYIAIENEDPNVEALYNSLFNLVKYFSVDAASILSVSVLPTDNDGD
ncbi:hypothetical protein GCM10022291_02750 [Postechiella marina]|uniref:Imelysin-like domain-containing protein n=1 Tax=Postechiella marina TaxID=943941 RepID=A0ABP8BZM9_9FLAO